MKARHVCIHFFDRISRYSDIVDLKNYAGRGTVDSTSLIKNIIPKII